jgi:hypothetical protein
MLGRTESRPFHWDASRALSEERNLNRTSKLQSPISREAPNIKYQSPHATIGPWSLVFLWSLGFGAWSFSTSAQTLPLPPRPANAPSGTAFIERITPLDRHERENEIFMQITSGNVPNFLRKLCPVQVTNVFKGRINRATFFVTPDYLAVGSDEDYFLTPISPNTAQRIGDVIGCSLPTRKMVNDIYAAAVVKLGPSPIPPSAAMTTVPVFSNHNAIVRAQRAEYLKDFPLGALVAGHQKDIVISAKLSDVPGNVAIYGWHRTNGAPIQPLYLGHGAKWVDYSQCTRLVQTAVTINGTNATIAQVLAHPELSSLLSDEGPLSHSRYPTNDLASASTNVTSTVAAQKRRSLANFTGFRHSNSFNERVASFSMDPEIKIQINAPSHLPIVASNNVLLIFYALPNGNTIEQTVGRTRNSGDDERYEIQHVGAQTRFIRSLLPNRSIVVVYLENDLKSWPSWRKKYGDGLIPDVINSVKQLFATNNLQVVLNSHSGGGSFIFGYLNAVKKISDDVVRITFLDSDYAYERARGHTDKLVQWLNEGSNRFLCVLAYNDAAGLLNGKPFVSAAGGAWGKSHEMQRDLAEAFNFTSRTNGNFERFSALDGRVQFILRDNPERQIFHSTQVELNGFIHSLVSGTTNESKGYEYFGERAYSKWIEGPSASNSPSRASEPQ